MGKYAVDVASFEGLALPQLAPHCPGVRLHVVDEVGKMELLSPAFFPAVAALLDAAPMVLGTVPVARAGRTIPQVGARAAGGGQGAARGVLGPAALHVCMCMARG